MKSLQRWRWPFALFLAISLFYWKIFFPKQFTFLAGIEQTNQAFSWLNFWVRSVHSGTLPLWDPYTYAGHLFPGEMQTAAFNPLNLIALLFPLTREGMIYPLEYNVLFLIGHIMAALFMYALIVEMGQSKLAAFVSGLCFSTGGLVGRAPWPDMLQSATWLPLILLFVLRALRQDRTRSLVLNGSFAGLCLGMTVLGGRVHMTVMDGIAVLLALAFVGSQPGASRKRTALIAGIVIVTAVCAAAIQLFPSAVYSQHSIRSYGETAFPSTHKPPYIYVSDHLLYPIGVLSAIFPFLEGAWKSESWPPYIGVLPLMMAIIAVVRRWSSVWVRYLVFLAALGYVYSMGWISALHGAAYVLVPFLWVIREAVRFLYLVEFAFCVLAAIGLDVVMSRAASFDTRSYRRALVWCMGIASVLYVVPVFWKVGNFWLSFSCLMIIVSGFLAWYVLGTKDRVSTGTRLVAIALIFFDLNAFAWYIDDRIAARKAGTDQHEIVTSAAGAAGFLKEQARREQPFRVHIIRNGNPNIGDSFGIETDSGMGATVAARFWRISSNLDLLNVRYLLKASSVSDSNPVYTDQFWKVYENKSAFPRSWLVHQSAVEPDENLLYEKVNSKGIDLRQTALLSAPLDSSLEPTAAAESSTVRLFAPHSFQVGVHAGSTALLILSEIYWPEWRAYVNGRETKIYCADGALRAVVVPPGDSLISFVYRPWSFYSGAALSLMTFVAIGIFAFSEHLRKRTATRLERDTPTYV